MLIKHFKNAHCEFYEQFSCRKRMFPIQRVHLSESRGRSKVTKLIFSNSGKRYCWIPTLTHSYHRSLQNWTCRLFFIIIDTKWKKIDTCHFKGLKGSDRKVSLWGIKNKHGGNPIAESICTYTGSLRVVPHFSSGKVERAKRERAWKSPHARKGVLGLIVAGYVPLASQNPYPIIVYSVANYIWL